MVFTIFYQYILSLTTVERFQIQLLNKTPVGTEGEFKVLFAEDLTSEPQEIMFMIFTHPCRVNSHSKGIQDAVL